MKRNGRVRSVLLLGALLAVLLCASCQQGSRKEKQLNPVHGHVFVDGKAPQGAIVTFHSLGGELAEILTTAIVEKDGSFAVTSYDPQKRSTYEGAYAGNYRVSIVWYDPAVIKRRILRSRITKIPLRNQLPERYMKPQTSGLHAQIKEGSNELTPFQLTKQEEQESKQKEQGK
jgi:hypothetical protein